LLTINRLEKSDDLNNPSLNGKNQVSLTKAHFACSSANARILNNQVTTLTSHVYVSVAQHVNMKNEICRVNFEFVDSKRSASIANKDINADNCPIRMTVTAEQTGNTDL